MYYLIFKNQKYKYYVNTPKKIYAERVFLLIYITTPIKK